MIPPAVVVVVLGVGATIGTLATGSDMWPLAIGATVIALWAWATNRRAR